MDIFSKKKRSQIMSSIRSTNTGFENKFIKELKKRTKHKFNTHASTIKGKPDIVFLKQKICVFLDSDFWHGWQYPRWKNILKNNFWKRKIEYNRKRDRNTTFYLRRAGWKVLRIWGHQIDENVNKMIDNIIAIL